MSEVGYMTPELPVVEPAFKDRKTGLIVFGVFEILLGGMCLLMMLFSLLGQVVAAHRPEMAAQYGGARSVVMTMMLMGGFAVVLIWLGVGSMMAKRWARALSLVLSWVWLIMGLFGSLFLVFTLPAMKAVMRQSAEQSGRELPPAAIAIALVFAVGFTLVIYVIVPAILLLFYRSQNVKLTCEARHSEPSWTDRCPLPVLAAVLMLAIGAVMMLFMLPTYGRVFPLVGIIVKGAPALLIYVGFAVLSAYLARGFYRLDRRALWIGIGWVLFGSINGLCLVAGGKLMAFYEAVQLPQAQLERLRTMSLMQSPLLIWLSVIGGVGALGYLWWIRRFFVPAVEVPGDGGPVTGNSGQGTGGEPQVTENGGHTTSESSPPAPESGQGDVGGTTGNSGPGGGPVSP